MESLVVTVLSGNFAKSFPIPICLYRTVLSCRSIFDLQMATGSRSYFSSKVLDSPRWCLYELAYYLKDETAMDRRIFKSYQLTCVSGHFTQYAGKVSGTCFFFSDLIGSYLSDGDVVQLILGRQCSFQ